MVQNEAKFNSQRTISNGEEMNIMLDERPELSVEEIDQEIAFQTAEMLAYGAQIIYPNEDKQIILNAIENCKSNIS